MTEQETEEERLRELIRLLRQADACAGQEDVPAAQYRIPASRFPERHRTGVGTLTKTEVAVMRFLGWGRANADIATLLVISENTVRVHRNNMCRKLELDGVRELNALAMPSRPNMRFRSRMTACASVIWMPPWTRRSAP
ncbi:response regulator transcription factor [Sphingobium sp.]|uniref:response regulator transcription factor n=1 Tax=Sphingobium sp. TaxID=1912891 RepID=UPI003B3A94A1